MSQFNQASQAILTTNLDTSSPVAFARRLDQLPMEGGTDLSVGNVQWRTLISNDRTPSNDIVLGIAEFPPNGTLHLHRHIPPEFYLCQSGSGMASVNDQEFELTPGTVVFIPGGTEHGVIAGSDGLILVYGFSQNAFSNIEYTFTG